MKMVCTLRGYDPYDVLLLWFLLLLPGSGFGRLLFMGAGGLSGGGYFLLSSASDFLFW